MLIKNLIVVLIYRITIVIFACLGLAYSIGMQYGRFVVIKFVYYTQISNLLCCIFFIAATIYTIKQIKCHGIKANATLWPRLKLGLTIMISMTFLIYFFILAPRITNPNYSPYTVSNLFLHYIVPIMVMADWLLFDSKNTYRKYDPFLWLIGPLAYLLFILIRAHVLYNLNVAGNHYPYFFINIKVLETRHFILYIGSFALFCVILGYIFLLIAKLMRKKTGQVS